MLALSIAGGAALAAACGGSDSPIVVGPGAGLDSGDDSTSPVDANANGDHTTGGPDAPAGDAPADVKGDATTGGDASEGGSLSDAADATSGETGPVDSGGGDSGSPDTGTADTGTPDTGSPDTGTPDAGADTGGPDTGSKDAAPEASPEAGPAVCGDGVREPPEQCDDGNTTSFDGCSSACAFEQSTRATKVALDWTTDATCGANAIGKAFGSGVHTAVQNMIDSSVASGAVTVLLTYLSLQDLAGKTGTTNVGSVTGLPSYADAGAYDGSADLDWWYPVDPSSLSGGQIVSKLLPGTFSAAGLSAGPGTVWVSFSAGQQLKMVQTSLSLPIGATSKPLTSTGLPPGHLAGEHLDTTLVSFSTGGGANAAPTGSVCGRITAKSLATSSIPSALLAGGADACNEGYTTANSMLDVFIGGCKTSIFQVVVINAASQPDTVDPDSPAAGTGPLYKLSASSATTKNVDTCKDGSGATVDLQTCLAAAAYSSYMHLAVDRVILR
jgi:cysteine-rich repeat protein